MDKGVEFAKLQLEGEVEIELPRQNAELGDDAQAMVDVADVIIGEFEMNSGSGNARSARRRLVKMIEVPVVAGRPEIGRPPASCGAIN